jgi:DNA-binding response OmpR family regulator
MSMQVLVVEDDVMLADFLAEALVEDGHTVCGIASTVVQAVALAREHRPDIGIFDMQLLDGERGSDVADQLWASGDLGHTGVLYVTGEAERVHREARVGHACLSKPFAFNTLYQALQIVRDIAREGGTLRVLPRGMQLLNTHPLTAT